jgi:ribonucleoside-triphosphate reductase
LLALKSLSKRIFPNFANGDCILAKEDPDNKDTIFATMGCRTLTGTDVNSEIPTEYSVRVGRGNCAPATIILPNLAMKYSYLT